MNDTDEKELRDQQYMRVSRIASAVAQMALRQLEWVSIQNENGKYAGWGFACSTNGKGDGFSYIADEDLRLSDEALQLHCYFQVTGREWNSTADIQARAEYYRDLVERESTEIARHERLKGRYEAMLNGLEDQLAGAEGVE